MRFKFYVLALAALVASPAPAAMPAEDAFRATISAINGSAADRSAFVGSAFSTKALQSRSAAERIEWLDKVAADSQGLTIVSAAPQGDRMVEAIVHTNKGDRFGKIVIFTSAKEPGKISDLFLLAARDPAKVKAEAWPTGKLPLSRVASEIEKHASALASEDSFSGVVLVAKGDKVIVNRAFGLADQEWKAPNRPDTLFHAASMGKMFTAAAVLQLARQGELTLDDNLAKWVPEYPHPEAAKITLRQLLTHSAGIGDWDVRQKTEMTGAQAARLMTEALQFDPGSRFSYSNAGFVLLQAVIEKASGKPFAEALEELVFKPAGMRSTALLPVTAIVHNRANGYLRPNNDPLQLGQRFSNAQFLGFVGDGAGGEYSTASDLLAFNRALGSGKLLGPEFTSEMLTPRIDMAGAPHPAKYGYGIEIADCGGHATFGHGGGGPHSGVDDSNYYIRDGGWSIIVLSNYDPPAGSELAHSICEFVAGR